MLPFLRQLFRLNIEKLSLRKMTTDHFKGTPLTEIHRGQRALDFDHLPPVENRRDHAVLYQLPIQPNINEPPEAHKGESKWDREHVCLPCDPRSVYKTDAESDPHKKVTAPRWEIVQQALLRPISSTRELQQQILTYNMKYRKEWKFRALHALCEELDEEENNSFFEKLLPFIIGFALQLPEIVPSAIPLLKCGENRSISLSQKQIACLLANAFLCTFPNRNEAHSRSTYATFPSINFNTLFQSNSEQNVEKIKCICNYFRRVQQQMPTGVVTFTRRSVSEGNLIKWDKCSSTFGSIPLHISDDGTIEDDGDGLLQVDFANKYLGGGVLNYGCVQEEIRFVICPELLVSRLFTECLLDNECMIIMGCERFNAYHGYASTFEWRGDIRDKTPFDDSRRRKCTIVAIDAIPFHNKAQQYKESMLKRELDKAYIGFRHSLKTPAPGVATGNWGCGAFNGDKLLKSLLQLMACCVTQQPLVYYTFGDVELRDKMYAMYLFLAQRNVKVADVWSCLRRYGDQKQFDVDLYDFLYSCLQDHKQYKLSTNGQSSIEPKRPIYKPPTDEPMAAQSEMETSDTFRFSDSDEDFSQVDEYNVSADAFDKLKKNDTIASDKMESVVESDDDMFSEDDILKSVRRTEQEYHGSSTNVQSKKTSESSFVTKTRGSHGSHTIQTFFSSTSSTTKIECQEKRPQPSLLQSLDESYHQKPASKIKRTADSSTLKSDRNSRANSSIATDGKRLAKPVTNIFDSMHEDIDLTGTEIEEIDDSMPAENLFDALDSSPEEQNIAQANTTSDKVSNNPSTSGIFDETGEANITNDASHSDGNTSEDFFEDAECDSPPEMQQQQPSKSRKDSPMPKKGGTDRSRQSNIKSFF